MAIRIGSRRFWVYGNGYVGGCALCSIMAWTMQFHIQWVSLESITYAPPETPPPRQCFISGFVASFATFVKLGPALSCKQMRILVIEDEKRIADFLSRG